MGNCINNNKYKEWEIEIPKNGKTQSIIKNIKSIFILKEIFSFLNANRKLDIII